MIYIRMNVVITNGYYGGENKIKLMQRVFQKSVKIYVHMDYFKHEPR